MLESRAAQTGVMVGVMGLTFGMILAPVPNAASEYVLGMVLEDMQQHYDQHQAAVDGFKITTSTTRPHFLVNEFQVESAVDNPSECENDEGHLFRFEESVLSDHNCVEIDYHYTYGLYGAPAYIPSTANTPPRISFYVDEEGQNSMYINIDGGDNG